MKYFPPFRFDTRRGLLTRAGRPLPLTRKAADILACLIAGGGDVVTQADILARVWSDTHVHPGNIKVLVRELRLALDDDARRPRYIRTEAGRGYSFIAQATDALLPLLTSADAAQATSRVGRDDEFAQLTERLAMAIGHGAPQLILLAGGRGLGKTHLCRALAEHACARGDVRVASAAALEIAATGTDLALPFEALESLERQYQAAVPALLERCAPGQRGAGLGSSTTTESDADDLAAAFTTLAAGTPLLLILEDIQWADSRSLAFLRALGRRSPLGPLCVLATMAPASDAHLATLRAINASWPVQRRTVVSLDPWTPAELNTLLEQRLGRELAPVVRGPLEETAGGNPALATSAVESLLRGLRAPIDLDLWLEHAMRDAVRDLADRLPSLDRHVLEVAAGLGPNFTAADIAAFLPASDALDAAHVQARLDGMAGSHLLVRRASWRRADVEAVFQWRAPVVAETLSARAAPTGRRLTAAFRAH